MNQMDRIAFGVKIKKNFIRYFSSRLKAEKVAEQYSTTIIMCYNVPKFRIEE